MVLSLIRTLSECYQGISVGIGDVGSKDGKSLMSGRFSNFYILKTCAYSSNQCQVCVVKTTIMDFARHHSPLYR